MIHIFSTKLSRIILMMLSTCVCFNCFAQHFSYSASIGNYSYTETKIIGGVKNNIIVWSLPTASSLEYKKSEILVFNDQLELLNTTSFKSVTPKLASVDFVNNGNSFEAIIQYHENGFFICRLANFDADGNILGIHTLDSLAGWSFGNYVTIKSPRTGDFALLKVVPSDINGTIALQYHFIQNSLLIHSDKIIVPFDTLSSQMGNALLDDNNLIFPVLDSLDAGQRLALYKVDLQNNASINTLRNLNEGQLVAGSINMNATDRYYTIIAKSKKGSADFNVPGKIFLWPLDKDFTDVSTDTLLTNIDSINSCLKNIHYYKLQSIALNNDASDIFLVADEVSGKAVYFSRPAYGVASIPGSFYGGRVLSMTPLQNLNGNGYYAQSNVAGGTASANNNPGVSGNYNRPEKLFPQPATLAVLNIDSKNKIHWSQCFNISMEDHFISLVNESAFVNTNNGLHIIYPRLTGKNKQSLSDIILKQDGSYSIKPIVSMNVKYTYILTQAVQLDETSLLIPCTIKGKLAFAKLKVE